MTSNALARHVPQVRGEVVGSHDDRYYRSLSDEELVHALRQSVRKVSSGWARTNAEMRQHLLPALMVLRERFTQRGRRKPVPEKPTYTQVLRSIGLNPATVRKWFSRSVSADEVLVLLGEPRKRKRPCLPVTEGSSSDELLLKAADRMAAALLKGEIDFARRLAREYAEARGSL